MSENNVESTPAPASEEPKPAETHSSVNADSIYDFTVKDIDGNDVSMEKYRGHPLIVVNVASNCGFTKKNYHELNELYSKYKDAGLRIAAFPCNQFMNQESACEADIKEFAKKNNVEFDMFSKVSVNGNEALPLFTWLKNKQKGLFGTTSIKWNFTKFLVSKAGIPTKRFAPTTSPAAMENDIKALIDA